MRFLFSSFVIFMFWASAWADDDLANASAINDSKNLESIRIKAEAGDASAQYTLAHAYFHGEGVGQNYAESMKWLEKAASGGIVEAQDSIASCYDSGLGVAEDKVAAVKWYRKAAEQGYANAEFNLGRCLHEDDEQDLSEMAVDVHV